MYKIFGENIWAFHFFTGLCFLLAGIKLKKSGGQQKRAAGTSSFVCALCAFLLGLLALLPKLTELTDFQSGIISKIRLLIALVWAMFLIYMGVRGHLNVMRWSQLMSEQDASNGKEDV